MRAARSICAAVALAAGCGDDADEGTRTAPRTVAVPEADATPPEGVIGLALTDGTPVAKAARPGAAPARVVRLEEPRIRGIMVGVDAQSGAARVRVSIQETVSCRRVAARPPSRKLLRHFPPSQVERIRSSTGARLATRRRRSVAIALGEGRCPAGARLAAVEGELWGDVTNGLGLEAVTPHIRFTWTR